MIGAVVESGKLLEVVLYALCATVAVATLFSLAILGVLRATERRTDSRATALTYGALAAVCLGGCLAAAAYGIVLLASK